MYRQRLRFKKGVTLVELLVIVSILSLLVGVTTWFLRTQIFKGRDAKRKGDIRQIQVAIEEYEKDHDCYPLPHIVSCNPGKGLQPYLSKVPCDPTTNSSYYYEHEDSACPQWYRLYASLENESDAESVKIGCEYGCGPGLVFDYYASSPNAPAPPAGTGGSGGGSGPTPSPPPQIFYGCFGSVCQPINWDPERPGPECDPNYQSPTCYNQCGMPETECQNWTTFQ